MVKVVDLTFSYDGVHPVLEDLNVEFGPGITSVLGPNGSGKTTLLKVLNGILKPISGKVYIDGEDVSKISRRDLSRKITLVSQEFESIFDHTVLDIVLMGSIPRKLFPNGSEIEGAIHALETVGLVGFEGRGFKSLSGGEKRLVLFAKALFQGSEVLTVDEVELHLDPKHRATIGKILKRIVRSGKTVVAVFHDVNLAIRVSDRILGLRNGKTVFDMKPWDEDLPDAIENLYETRFHRFKADGRWFLDVFVE